MVDDRSFCSARRVGVGAIAWLVGHREPWDADGHFYVLALAIAGAVAGLLTPRPL